MILSQQHELISKLICIAEKNTLTLNGVKLLHAEVNDAQINRLLEQCDELIQKHTKLSNNLLKIAKIHLDSFNTEE